MRDRSPKILSVSELTQKIETLFEEHFGSVSLKAEISNFKAHSSGHFYFSLKDEKSQIQAVCFKGTNRFFKFKPEDGLEVLIHGRLAVYPPRGSYQIIVEWMEPFGLGAWQLAFDQLKKKLSEKGFFDASRKQPLPKLPKNIALITSPTGAVVRDLIHVLRRRYPNIEILIYPVRVQGNEAVLEISEAIKACNKDSISDLIILARGGGSIEDLWAFNSEAVAEAIFASKIPMISAIGHETDFTIADFVADLRAPTPSAAAELAVPVKRELEDLLDQFKKRLQKDMQKKIEFAQIKLDGLSIRLKNPRQKLEELLRRLEETKQRVRRSIIQTLKTKENQLESAKKIIKTLSPLRILERGYAIVYKKEDSENYRPLKDAKGLKLGDKLGVQLAKTSIEVRFETED